MRILIAARPYDLSAAPADAFVSRHLAMVELLADQHAVDVVLLRPSFDHATPVPAVAGSAVGEVALPDRSNTRGARLGRTVGRLAGGRRAAWEAELSRLAASRQPQVVVTVGPWLDVEYRSLFRLAPSVHVFEEDLTRMPGMAAQSRQARALRAAEDAASRRAGMRPDAVVVISHGEVDAARRRFTPTTVVHVPYALDPAQWPLASDVSTGDAVLVVGNLSQDRNSGGLVEVLAAIEERSLGGRLPFRLASAAGLTPDLAALADRPWITRVDPEADLAGEYRRASVALVASTQATGFKTTILQAWSAGCPVVCLPSSAATLGADAQSAVCVVPTPRDAVDALRRLQADPAARAALAAGGLAHARRHHDWAAEQRRFLDLVEGVAAGDPNPGPDPG